MHVVNSYHACYCEFVNNIERKEVVYPTYCSLYHINLTLSRPKTRTLSFILDLNIILTLYNRHYYISC